MNEGFAVGENMNLEKMQEVLRDIIYAKNFIRNRLNHAGDEGSVDKSMQVYFSSHGYNVNDELSHDEIIELYLDSMAKASEEIFGFRYIDEYLSKFPAEDETNVREALTKLAESLHSGVNAAAVAIFVNNVLIRTWLEQDDVRNGYGEKIW